MFIVFATEGGGVISELCIASHLCVTSDVKPHSLLLLFLGVKQYPWLPIFVLTKVPIIALFTPRRCDFRLTTGQDLIHTLHLITLDTR